MIVAIILSIILFIGLLISLYCIIKVASEFDNDDE